MMLITRIEFSKTTKYRHHSIDSFLPIYVSWRMKYLLKKKEIKEKIKKKLFRAGIEPASSADILAIVLTELVLNHSC